MITKITNGAFGRLLRYWRQVRKLSQEDVAWELESSTKHISFLENGKSMPSRELTIKLATYFKLSAQETNNLLAAANFFPDTKSTLSPQELQFLDDSLKLILMGLDPVPSIIIDHNGNVKMMNKAWAEIIGNRIPSIQQRADFNLLDIYLAEDGLRLYMDKWQDMVCALLVALQQEVLLFQEESSKATLNKYSKHKLTPVDWQQRGASKLKSSGMYSQIKLPNSEPQTFLNVLTSVGGMRFIPEPMLMVFSIFPKDASLLDTWRKRMEGKSYQHALLKYDNH